MTAKVCVHEGRGASDENGMHLCVCVVGERALYLRTEATRVPQHAEDEAQAVGLTPPQTAPLCAAPGCPRYLKTESKQRGDAKVNGTQRKEGRDKEGRMEEEKRTRKGRKKLINIKANKRRYSKDIANVALRNYKTTVDICWRDLY